MATPMVRTGRPVPRMSVAMAAATKADISILPSSEMSMTPDFSEKMPAIAQNRRCRHPEGGVDRQQELATSQPFVRPPGGCPAHAARAAAEKSASGCRAIGQPAESRMIRPWISRTISRVIVENSNQPAPLVARRTTGGQHDADRMVAAHQRHRDPGEAVAGGVEDGPRWTPRISLIAIMPVRPPEMAMVTMMMVPTGMPVYSAVAAVAGRPDGNRGASARSAPRPRRMPAAPRRRTGSAARRHLHAEGIGGIVDEGSRGIFREGPVSGEYPPAPSAGRQEATHDRRREEIEHDGDEHGSALRLQISGTAPRPRQIRQMPPMASNGRIAGNMLSSSRYVRPAPRSSR